MNALNRRLASLPLRGKLMLLATLASAMALVTAGVVLAFVDYHAGKRALLQRLQTHAEITARNTTAAVAFDDVLDDGEAQAGPPLVMALGDIHPIEPLGQARQVLRGDAGAVILHGESDPGPMPSGGGLDPGNLHIHPSAALAVLDRILDQVLGNAAQAEPARHHHHAVEGQPFQRGCRVGTDFLGHEAPIGSLPRRKVPSALPNL